MPIPELTSVSALLLSERARTTGTTWPEWSIRFPFSESIIEQCGGRIEETEIRL
jgi:hypothetical protein